MEAYLSGGTVSLNLNKRSKKFMVTKIWLYWMLRTISSSFDTFWVNPITSKGFYEVQILQCRIWNWCLKNGCRGRIMKIRNLATSHECSNLVRKWKVLWSWGAQFSAWWRRKLQIIQCKSWSPRTGLDVIGYFQHAFIIDIWGKIDCYVLIKVTMSLDNGLFKLRDYVMYLLVYPALRVPRYLHHRLAPLADELPHHLGRYPHFACRHVTWESK